MIAAFMVPQKRDFISRDDAKIAAWTILEGMGVSSKHNDRLGEEVDAVVDDIPAADVRPVVRGKWIWDDEGYHCLECFFHAYGNTLECMDGTYKYCPNCGARMEES